MSDSAKALDSREQRKFATGCVGFVLLLLGFFAVLFARSCSMGICLVAGGEYGQMFAHTVDVCHVPEGSPCPRHFTPSQGLCIAEDWVVSPLP